MITLLLATTLFFALTSLFLVRRMILLIDRNRELQVQVDEAELDLAIAYRTVEQEEEWPDFIGV